MLESQTREILYFFRNAENLLLYIYFSTANSPLEHDSFLDYIAFSEVGIISLFPPLKICYNFIIFPRNFANCPKTEIVIYPPTLIVTNISV